MTGRSRHDELRARIDAHEANLQWVVDRFKDRADARHDELRDKAAPIRRLWPAEHHRRCNTRAGKSCDCYMRSYAAASAALDALLEEVAAAEARAAELERKLAQATDRAVCSGCGQDTDGACGTIGCESGELIPSSDLPWALDTMRRAHAEEWAEWLEDNSELEDALTATRARAEKAEQALREARPYVYGIALRKDWDNWAAAESVLASVDAALAAADARAAAVARDRNRARAVKAEQALRELVTATTTWDDDLSSYCDGDDRTRVREALVAARDVLAAAAGDTGDTE